MSVYDRHLANRSPVFVDRYIPRSSTSLAYRSKVNDTETDNNNQRGTVLPLSECRYFASIGTFDANENKDNKRRKTTSTAEDRMSGLQKNIADALGYKEDQKVLEYKNGSHTICSQLDLAGPLFSELSTKEVMRLTANIQIDGGKKISITRPVESLVASSTFLAPGLRNDYYSNLISWSKVGNKIAVGLGENTHMWGEENVIQTLDYDLAGPVTCVSFSPNSYMIICTGNGKLFLYDHVSEKLLTRFSNRGICTYCVRWFPGRMSKNFLIGNENGEIQLMEIVDSPFIHLRQRAKFKCHQQQICEIVLSLDCSQMVVGANDNCCSIWEMTDIEKPNLKFVLPHAAAVKAIAFCPWTPSLLATGGGSKDRTIRFWHTKTGALLHSWTTNGQITSLIWSNFKKELVTTFGFSDCLNPVLIKKYSYPLMTTIVEVRATPDLRILSAAISPDASSVVVATNDSTVRIYKLWEKTMDIISSPEFQGSGVYGSDIIELGEGINIKHDKIR